METNYSRVCDYCKRTVDVGEGVVEDSIWYHDPCYITASGKKMAKLKRKIDNGQISAQEIQEYQDLLRVCQNIAAAPTGISLTHTLHAPKQPDKAIYTGSACKLLGLNVIKKQDTGLIVQP